MFLTVELCHELSKIEVYHVAQLKQTLIYIYIYTYITFIYVYIYIYGCSLPSNSVI